MNRTFIIVSAALLFSGVLLVSCYKDKEELLYPDMAACDTASVISYTNHIVPIVSNYCYACHGNSNYLSAGGNLNLEGYANISIPIQDGALIKSINHVSGVSSMPKNSPKLSSCKIKMIQDWVNQGFPNN